MKEPIYSETVRRALRALPVDTMVRAMDAFSHPPRCVRQRYGDDICGCWVSAAIGDNAGGNFEAFAAKHGLYFNGTHGYGIGSPVGEGEVDLLSHAYEEYNEWFKGECIREIAERSRSRKGAAKIAAAKT